MFTEKEITQVLTENLYCEVFVANCFLYSWESDLLGINKDGTVAEFEIKCSRHDYLKDAEKYKKHAKIAKLEDLNAIPNQFYYVFSEDISIDIEVPEYAGLIVIERVKMMKKMRIIKPAPMMHENTIDNSRWKEIAIKLSNKLY